MNRILILILFLGMTFANVLDRYDTLKAQSYHIIDENGKTLTVVNRDIFDSYDKKLKKVDEELAKSKLLINNLKGILVLSDSLVYSLKEEIENLKTNLDIVNAEIDFQKQFSNQYKNSDSDELNKVKNELSLLKNSIKQIEIKFLEVDESIKKNSSNKEIITNPKKVDFSKDWDKLLESIVDNSELADVINESANTESTTPEEYDQPPKSKLGKSIFDFLVYPKLAIEMKLEGKVFIKFFVDKKGKVRANSIQMIRGNPVFEEAAVTAVKKSEWKPAKKDGKNVGIWMTVPVPFKLNDEWYN